MARFLLAIRATPVDDLRVELTDINAGPAIVISSGARPMTVFALDICDRQVQTIHAIANPNKLKHIRTP